MDMLNRVPHSQAETDRWFARLTVLLLTAGLDDGTGTLRTAGPFEFMLMSIDRYEDGRTVGRFKHTISRNYLLVSVDGQTGTAGLVVPMGGDFRRGTFPAPDPWTPEELAVIERNAAG